MSKRDYESYNILEEVGEDDTEENTELVTINTELQSHIEQPETEYQEAKYHEEPTIETNDKNQQNTTNKKEKFKIKFPTFKKYKTHKERKPWERVLKIIGVILITILLAPVLGVTLATIGTIILALIGGTFVAIVGSILAGGFIFGGVCFFASQLTVSTIIGGLAFGIFGISLGLIFAILVAMFVKWVKKCIKARKLEKRGI